MFGFRYVTCLFNVTPRFRDSALNTIKEVVVVVFVVRAAAIAATVAAMAGVHL